MKVLQYCSLVAEILWGIIVTHFLCTIELFHFLIFDRRQKCVKGKIIVVTGAGHGLGRRVAVKFAELGAKVVCWDIDKERNANTVWDIRRSNNEAVAITCDVTDRVGIFRAFEEIRTSVGEPDIVVSCAGIYPVKGTLLWTPEELYTVFDTNIMAQFWLMQASLPKMIERKSGHFAVISSAAAMAPVSHEVPYSVTKSAVTGLMDGMIEELYLEKHNNIKISCIHPYYTACREDIPVKYELRFGRMSPDFVAAEIVKGIRQEREMISVPRFLFFWMHFMKLLPQTARRRWRDIFFTRVYYEPKNNNQISGARGNIVDEFRLPPLKTELSGVAVDPPIKSANNTTTDTVIENL